MDFSSFLKKLYEKKIRLSLNSEEKLKKIDEKKLDTILEKLILFEQKIINEEELDKIINEKELDKLVSEESIKKQIIVKRKNEFNPIAKEYDSDIKLYNRLDVTKKSISTGNVTDFVDYFKNRYERIKKMITKREIEHPDLKINEIKKIKDTRTKIRLIGLLKEKRNTKKGNILLIIEDDTGWINVVVTKYEKEEELFNFSNKLVLDEIIGIEAEVITGDKSHLLIAKDIYQPEIPYSNSMPTCEKDISIAYISDIHMGSKKFMEKKFNDFIDWIKGKGSETKIASKLKYIVIAGDIVDGIGIYPNQENDLVEKNIEKQYELFDNFVNKLPDYIEVIVSPGNHDAVRVADPQPAISNDLIKSDVLKIASPSFLEIEGIKHLIYHGTSLDMMISNIPGLNYEKPEIVMMEILKRRHLSPTYGGDNSNTIVPEPFDYLVIEERPDIVHMGHVHKNGYFNYRNCLIINSGTFQDQTDFQIRMGHKPSPGIVPIYEPKYKAFKTIRF